MGVLEDVIKALERIPAWKRMLTMQNELADLQARVKMLETRLASATGEQCPKCRSMSFTLVNSTPAPPPWGELGVRQDHYLCSACGYTDLRERNPS